MGDRVVASVERLHPLAPPNMIWIPGGMFRIGSDKHYPQEAPAHRLTVDGFWIDLMPGDRGFVHLTGHKTLAEIPPDPKNYPGALPHVLYAGSLLRPLRHDRQCPAMDDRLVVGPAFSRCAEALLRSRKSAR